MLRQGYKGDGYMLQNGGREMAVCWVREGCGKGDGWLLGNRGTGMSDAAEGR